MPPALSHAGRAERRGGAALRGVPDGDVVLDGEIAGGRPTPSLSGRGDAGVMGRIDTPCGGAVVEDLETTKLWASDSRSTSGTWAAGIRTRMARSTQQHNRGSVRCRRQAPEDAGASVSSGRAAPTEDLGESRSHEIAIRAFEIYLSREEWPGNDLEDWLQTEWQLRGYFDQRLPGNAGLFVSQTHHQAHRRCAGR